MSRGTYDVCAVVVSDLPFDARVWKEARSLAGSGRRLALLGCAYDRQQTQRRQVDGIDVLEIPFGWRNARKSHLRRAMVLLRLWLEVLRTPAHVYHAHNIHVALPAWLASKLRRARLVYDAHELYGEPEGGARDRLMARGAALLERLMVRSSDAVITTNPSRADVLRDRYGRTDITVLANVPALAEDVEPIDPGYPPGRRVLLYLGWIAAEARAFRETVQALRYIDDVDFVILGFGWESARELIRGWAREEGVEERVHFLPALPFDELAATSAAATVGLVPIRTAAINDHLGDTNKLHEYLMGGLPVAASDLPEIRRVVTSGTPAVGELFDPSSPESIARSVKTLLADEELYNARRREARRLAREQFNWQLEEPRLLDLYRGLLDEADGA